MAEALASVTIDFMVSTVEMAYPKGIMALAVVAIMDFEVSMVVLVYPMEIMALAIVTVAEE